MLERRVYACVQCGRYVILPAGGGGAANAERYCSERCSSEELYGPGVGAPAPPHTTYATRDEACAALVAETLGELRIGAPA